MTTATLIITSPTLTVRRWIGRSGVAPYTSWNDRLEIPADTALAIVNRIGDLTSPESAEVCQALTRAAYVQFLIVQHGGQWYPVVDGKRIGFGFFDRRGALESLLRHVVQEGM